MSLSLSLRFWVRARAAVRVEHGMHASPGTRVDVDPVLGHPRALLPLPLGRVRVFLVDVVIAIVSGAIGSHNTSQHNTSQHTTTTDTTRAFWRWASSTGPWRPSSSPCPRASSPLSPVRVASLQTFWTLADALSPLAAATYDPIFWARDAVYGFTRGQCFIFFFYSMVLPTLATQYASPLIYLVIYLILL